MKTILLDTPMQIKIPSVQKHLVFAAFLLLWFFSPRFIQNIYPTAGIIDQSIWLIVLTGLITFMLITALCWWLAHGFWMSLGLPAIKQMSVHFKSLELWQQLGFLWASFALLLLAAVGSLMAIC